MTRVIPIWLIERITFFFRNSTLIKSVFSFSYDWNIWVIDFSIFFSNVQSYFSRRNIYRKNMSQN